MAKPCKKRIYKEAISKRHVNRWSGIVGKQGGAMSLLGDFVEGGWAYEELLS